MLIGEVIELCGVTRATIRHYEEKGLIDIPSRRDNNYKEYSKDTVRRVKFIRDMQGVGFTLRQTQELLALYNDGAATCGNTGPIIQAHRDDLDDKITRLTLMRSKLDEFFIGCTSDSLKGKCTPMVNSLDGI
jgi:DNA-binding transcriptional MerR regulator